MAINRSTRYPGRFDDPVAGQPEGAFKNKSGDLAVDGSYLEKDWANDWSAFFSSLLGGDAANGTVDAVGSSQLFQGLIDLIVPINRVIFTDDDVNPAGTYPGTTWARIAEGRFIASAGTHTDANGEQVTLVGGDVTAGEYSHELTEGEMPSHNHTMDSESYGNPSGGSNVVRGSGGGGYSTSATGGGAVHNNIPPGYAMYSWIRTA